MAVCKECGKPESGTCADLCEFHEFENDRKRIWFNKENNKLTERYIRGDFLGPGNRLEKLREAQNRLRRRIFEEDRA